MSLNPLSLTPFPLPNQVPPSEGDSENRSPACDEIRRVSFADSNFEPKKTPNGRRQTLFRLMSYDESISRGSPGRRSLASSEGNSLPNVEEINLSPTSATALVISKKRTAIKVAVYVTTSSFASVLLFQRFHRVLNHFQEFPNELLFIVPVAGWMGTFSTNYLLDEQIKKVALKTLTPKMRMFSAMTTLGVSVIPERLAHSVIELSYDETDERAGKYKVFASLILTGVVFANSITRAILNLRPHLCPKRNRLQNLAFDQVNIHPPQSEEHPQSPV